MEELKLELEAVKKGFEEKLASACTQAIEEFQTSDEFNRLKGDYAAGSYFHDLKEARAFLRSNPDAKPEHFKTIPEIAQYLELSESEGTFDEEEVDIDGEDGEDDHDSPQD